MKREEWIFIYSNEGERWLCQFSGKSNRFDDQLDAVLYGCGHVIALHGVRS